MKISNFSAFVFVVATVLIGNAAYRAFTKNQTSEDTCCAHTPAAQVALAHTDNNAWPESAATPDDINMPKSPPVETAMNKSDENTDVDEADATMLEGTEEEEEDRQEEVENDIP